MNMDKKKKKDKRFCFSTLHFHGLLLFNYFIQNNNEALYSTVNYYQLVLPCRWLIAL